MRNHQAFPSRGWSVSDGTESRCRGHSGSEAAIVQAESTGLPWALLYPLEGQAPATKGAEWQPVFQVHTASSRPLLLPVSMPLIYPQILSPLGGCCPFFPVKMCKGPLSHMGKIAGPCSHRIDPTLECYIQGSGRPLLRRCILFGQRSVLKSF